MSDASTTSNYTASKSDSWASESFAFLVGLVVLMVPVAALAGWAVDAFKWAAGW